MDIFDEIRSIEELRKNYIRLRDEKGCNQGIVIEAYIDWYSKASALFSSRFEGDSEYIKFRDVDNSGNGFCLSGNYSNLYTSYCILLNKLKMDTTNYSHNINKSIFIVHGHNNAIKESVARFVEQLEYESIILHEQADAGKTIIEKLEASISNICYGIVIYTSCDKGKGNNESRYKPRARQNVIFEHGYLLGKLGRSKVCCLYEKGVERPSDLDGVLYIEIDENNSWKTKIIKNMKAAGLKVNVDNFIEKM